jgi:hypothetical protein
VDIPDQMRLTGLIQAWIDMVELPAEIRLDESASTSSVEAACMFDAMQTAAQAIAAVVQD